MKKLKLRFCRIKCQLSFHVKILVNTRWPIMQKFTLELKSSPKTCFFDDMDKMMGVLWNIDLLIITRCLKVFLIMSFQRPKGSFDHLFIQLVSRVTKTNQDSPRSKMGRSFRIWSPFCHPSKTKLKCAFFLFFRKNQNFLKKGAFKAKIIARDMMWLCYKFYHCKVWNVSFH